MKYDLNSWINNILSIFEKKKACWIVSGVNERNSLPLEISLLDVVPVPQAFSNTGQR